MIRCILLCLLLSIASVAVDAQKLVRQRAGEDCATAAIATLAGVSYDHVATEERALKMEPREGKSVNQIVAIAAREGMYLELTLPPVDPAASGILIIRVPEGSGTHAVALVGGRVYDPDIEFPIAWKNWHETVQYFLRRQ